MQNVVPPSRDFESLKRKQADRYAFLRRLYDTLDGHVAARVDMREVGEALGFQWDRTNATCQWLSDEGLIEFVALGGLVTITHYGVQEVENSIERPAEATAHFAPTAFTIYNTTYTNVGSVVNQHGTGNSATVTATLSIGSDLGQALAGLRHVFSKLPAQEREDAFELVRAIEGEAVSTAPKKALVRSTLRSLREEYGSHVSLAADAAQLGQFLAQVATMLGC